MTDHSTFSNLRRLLVIPVVYTDDPNAKLKALKKELQQQKPK